MYKSTLRPHGPRTLFMAGIAAVIGLSPGTIRTYLSSDKHHRLPPLRKMPGSSRWYIYDSDLREWMASGPRSHVRRGRPPKAETLAQRARAVVAAEVQL